MTNTPSPALARPRTPLRRLRACVACTKAKARCHFQPENLERHQCNRCLSLSVECVAKSTQALRKPRQAAPLQSRVSTLEQKIDGLTARLAGSGSGSSSNHSSSKSTTIPSQSQAQVSSGGRAQSSAKEQPSLPILAPDTHPSGPPAPLGLTWPQCDWIIREFLQNYFPKFPFLNFATKPTAKALFAENPFVFRAIMLVASPLAMYRLVKIRRNVMAYLAQRLLVEDENSMDLLQGSLVLIIWSSLDSCGDPLFMKLVYLAIGLAHSLGVTKPPPSRVSTELPKLAEGHRTYLACAYATSVANSYYGRRSELGGKFIDTYCHSLSWYMSSQEDYLLEKVMRLIHLTEKISDVFGPPFQRDRKAGYSALMEGRGRPIRNQLSGISEGITEEHPHYPMFAMHFNYVLCRLYEPAVYFAATTAVDPTTSSSAASTSTVGSTTYRQLALRECLEAVKKFFTQRLAVPPHQNLYLPVATAEQTRFVLAVAARLLYIDAEGWRADQARGELDLPDIIGKHIALLDEARRAGAERWSAFTAETELVPEQGGWTPNENDLFARQARSARQVKEWYEAKLAGRTVADFLGEEWDGHPSITGKGTGDEKDTYWMAGLLGNSAWSFDGI